jgi:tetratricopeptide (TPR) repeat protein
MQAGNAEAAAKLLKQAAAGLPDVIGVRGNLGMAHTLNGNYDDAIYNIETAFRESPALCREPDLWIALIWAYLRTGRVPKAHDACERAEDLGIATPRLRLMEAFVVGLERGDMSTQSIEKVLHSAPGATPMVLEFAHYLAQRHKYDVAQQLIESLPEDSRGKGYRVVAYSALNGEDLETALWAGARCEYTTDDVAGAALLRSEIALRQRKLPDAAHHAQRAIEAGHDRSEAHEQLGRVLLVSGKWGAAVEQMIEALHSGRASALAAGVAALASINAGDMQTARRLFSDQRSGDGLGVAFAHVAQCHIMKKDGRSDEAVKLATWAMDEIDELPLWLRRPPLLRKMAEELSVALGDLADPDPRDGEHQMWRHGFDSIHQRVTALRDQCYEGALD